MLPKIATEKQKLVFEYGINHPYSIFAMDPRLGKTMVAIAIQRTLRNNCLVICPSYLIPNWKKEINKWHPKASVTTFKKGSEIYDVCDSDFVVISYDLIQKAEFLFEWTDMIIIDEVHNLKSMAAKRTEFIHKQIYENSIERVHTLSGTIIKNRVHEFYANMALMHYDPKISHVTTPKEADFKTFLKENILKVKDFQFLERFPDEITFADYFSHRKEYKVKVKTKKGGTFRKTVARWVGLKNSEELKLYLKGRYIRVKADEHDLPPIEYNSILVSDSENEELLEIFNNYFLQDESGSVRPEMKVAAAVQKVPFTVNFVEDLLEYKDCVLVYSDHVPSIEAIAQHFGVPAITGKMSPNKRSRLADEFQAGKGKLLCATIGSLNSGKDLFRAHDLVLNDPPWVPGDLKQVIDRMRGLNQKGSRTVHTIYGSPQDEKIFEAIKEKMETIEKAT